MKNLTSCLLLTFLMLNGCEKTPRKTDEQHRTNEEHRHPETEAINLNDGKKWVVDTAMMSHIRRMEEETHSFVSSDSGSYALLAEKLQGHLDLLTSNCTMTGKAHDELHKWLLPFIDLADALSEADNDSVASKIHEKMIVSFERFNEYFE